MHPTTYSAPIAVARIARALTCLLYALVIVTLVLLALGFVLKLFGANPDAPFADWLHRALRQVMAPFRRLFEPMPLDGRSVLDGSILFAMIVYVIVAMALRALIAWLSTRILELRVGDAASRGRASAA